MHPLIELYGEKALELAVEEIKELARASNIPFDKKYVDLGTSFLLIKAAKIVEGEQKRQSLKGLVCESFGEAAMYKYNVANGVL